MKPPQVAREGTKKTVFTNFMELAKAMNRQPEHMQVLLIGQSMQGYFLSFRPTCWRRWVPAALWTASSGWSSRADSRPRTLTPSCVDTSMSAYVDVDFYCCTSPAGMCCAAVARAPTRSWIETAPLASCFCDANRCVCVCHHLIIAHHLRSVWSVEDGRSHQGRFCGAHNQAQGMMHALLTTWCCNSHHESHHEVINKLRSRYINTVALAGSPAPPSPLGTCSKTRSGSTAPAAVRSRALLPLPKRRGESAGALQATRGRARAPSLQTPRPSRGARSAHGARHAEGERPRR